MSQRPKRSLGQNFLVDPNLQRKIVDALGAGRGDTVLEIGPGQGALTGHLDGSVGRLVLVELDDDLAAKHREVFQGRSDVEVIHGDVLELDLAELVPAPEELLVVGNIPYNITTPILFHLLEPPRPRRIVIMVQAEVADRIAAPVGTKAYGALSVGVRTVAEVEKLFRVGPGAFRPRPRVDSAVLSITPHLPARHEPDFDAKTRVVVRAAFQWRRKQIGKTLRSHPELRFGAEVALKALQDAGIDPGDRPETVSPERFQALTAALP